MVKMPGSCKLLVLPRNRTLTADLSTQLSMLSFNAPLMSDVTQLSSFPRLSQGVQTFFKNLQHCYTHFTKHMRSLCNNVYLFPRGVMINDLSLAPVLAPSNTKQASLIKLLQCSYVQAVHLFTQVTGRGERRRTLLQALSQPELPALPSATPCVVPIRASWREARRQTWSRTARRTPR